MKERRSIHPHESALLFELANHDKDEISISELNEKMKKRALDWELSYHEMQDVLTAAQQAQVISISSGVIKIMG
ncbi:hypothetical protein VDG1235_2137 [Verrucomicrobiia bacterium DG1235]|nr:hypothetical protein VDG1235_2137 [Verrucomicrobiae bacterium DG1235]